MKETDRLKKKNIEKKRLINKNQPVSVKKKKNVKDKLKKVWPDKRKNVDNNKRNLNVLKNITQNNVVYRKRLSSKERLKISKIQTELLIETNKQRISYCKTEEIDFVGNLCLQKDITVSLDFLREYCFQSRCLCKNLKVKNGDIFQVTIYQVAAATQTAAAAAAATQMAAAEDTQTMIPQLVVLINNIQIEVNIIKILMVKLLNL